MKRIVAMAMFVTAVGCSGDSEAETKDVTFELLNDSDSERICDFQYSFRDADGALVNGPQVPLRTVAAHQSIGATANVPLNQVVALTAACWHPKYPEESIIHAASSLRTEPVHDHVACRAVYTEDGGGPLMTILCQ